MSVLTSFASLRRFSIKDLFLLFVRRDIITGYASARLPPLAGLAHDFWRPDAETGAGMTHRGVPPPRLSPGIPEGPLRRATDEGCHRERGMRVRRSESGALIEHSIRGWKQPHSVYYKLMISFSNCKNVYRVRSYCRLTLHPRTYLCRLINLKHLS